MEYIKAIVTILIILGMFGMSYYLILIKRGDG